MQDKILLTLKIGKKEHSITEKDKFLTNGVTVELLGQTGVAPQLRDKQLKQINKYKRTQHKHNFGSDISIFSLSASSCKPIHIESVERDGKVNFAQQQRTKWTAFAAKSGMTLAEFIVSALDDKCREHPAYGEWDDHLPDPYDDFKHPGWLEGLPLRESYCIVNHGYKSLAELRIAWDNESERHFLDMPNFGKKSLATLGEWLESQPN